ncbi:MAG: alpha/beta hydrolase [Anaerolineales bacterium]|nr:MAG: alpha/beta hydrolase [Anaerolineales bacterium]
MSVIKSFDGAPIYYQVDGVGSPALIFVHGWCCNHTFWSSQLTHFSNNHLVITLDLAGHGGTKSERRLWNMENYAKDVVAVYESLGISEVILIGHSMGGAVILEAARLIGPNVKGLICVDAIVYSFYSEMTNDQIDAYVQPYENDFASTMKDLVSYMLPDDVDRDLYHQITTVMSSVPMSVALPSLRAILAWDFRKSLTRLQAPLTCLCARDSISEINLEEFDDLLTIRSIPDVGHFLMMEDPLAFNRELESLIDELNKEKR